MNRRWIILAVLFFARFTMGFQFQSVAALSPLMVEAYGLSLADIGLLIGLYLAPGLVVAIPGSRLAERLGEKRTVMLALLLMLAGGAVCLVAPTRDALVIGRLLAGVGGVLVTIVPTKMLVDWFAGREISTALAIFVTSWPVGIAAALFVLPPVALAGGLASAWWVAFGVIAAGLVLFLWLYAPPPDRATETPSPRSAGSQGRIPVRPLVLAGLVWALYNTALAMVFGFGTPLLTQTGWSVDRAGVAISLFMAVFSFAVPLGGVLADRTGRNDTIILTSLVSFAVLMPFVPVLEPRPVIAFLLAVGILFALAAGPIMALPSAVLPAEARTFGMGVFFTIYYGVMMVAPRLAGGLADHFGDASVALYSGAALCIAAAVALGSFRLTQTRHRASH